MQTRQTETARVFYADMKKLARAIREHADAERNEDRALQAFRKDCPRFDELKDDRFAADERTRRAEEALKRATAGFEQKYSKAQSAVDSGDGLLRNTLARVDYCELAGDR